MANHPDFTKLTSQELSDLSSGFLSDTDALALIAERTNPFNIAALQAASDRASTTTTTTPFTERADLSGIKTIIGTPEAGPPITDPIVKTQTVDSVASRSAASPTFNDLANPGFGDVGLAPDIFDASGNLLDKDARLTTGLREELEAIQLANPGIGLNDAYRAFVSQQGPGPQALGGAGLADAGGFANTSVAPTGGGQGGAGQTISMDEVITAVMQRMGFTDPSQLIIEDADGNKVVHPLLEQLLITADAQNGFVSAEQISEAENTNRLAIAEFEGNARVAAAEATGASTEQVAQIRADADTAIEAARSGSDESIARINAAAEKAIAQINLNSALNTSEKQVEIAKIQSQADQAIAGTQAGATSPFGFVGQGGSLADAIALTQAQSNPFGQTAQDRLQQVQAQFNPFGFSNEQGFSLGQAGASDNPFGFLQQNLGQENQLNRNALDQVLRGGLSPEQQRQLAIAEQSGAIQGNLIDFIGNPSAVGFATERGLLGNVLGDISNAPEGLIPGSLFGVGGAASPTGTGPQQSFNPTANTLRNASDEQIGFLQGRAAAQGTTPSEFNTNVESFTPQGV